jgi:hypothetical protein
MKKKLLVSFSGGKSSGYMLWWIFNEWQDRHNWEIVVVFANTGKEVEGTLLFVDECANEWGIDIVWVEAKCKDDNGVPFSEKGRSVKHKVVNFETASRNGEPFEEMISILGIPSTNAPLCSYQLKRAAIMSYIKSIGWDDYYTAIGVRVDEPKRLPSMADAENKKIIYFLAHVHPTTKKFVSLWWSNRGFNLDIHPDDGNCDNCWKKDLNRLCRNARRKPNSFDWWQNMTDKYGHLNPREVDLEPPFNFYRGNLSPKEILEIANKKNNQTILFTGEPFNSCEESCEAF